MKKIAAIFSGTFIPLFLMTSIWAFESSGMDRVDIHGFISQGYADASGNHEYPAEGFKDGTFEFNEMGVNFSAEPDDNLRVGLQLFAYDLGNIGNDEVVLDWAFADYRFKDYFGIRAGLLKIPHALYSETRDIDMLRTSIFLPVSIYGEIWRDAFSRMKGVGIYGDLPAGLSYQASVGVLSPRVVGGFTRAFETIIDFEADHWESDYSYVVNLLWNTPLDGLKLGISQYETRNSKLYGITGDTIWPFIGTLKFIQGETDHIVPLAGLPCYLDYEKIAAAAISIEYVLEKLTIACEYGQNPVKINIVSVDPGETSGQKIYGNESTMEAYYGGAAYRFTHWFETGMYYSELYIDKDDKDGSNFDLHPMIERSDTYIKDLAITTRFDINENWLLKLEAHKMRGTLMVTNYEVDRSKDWEFYAAKITYSF